MTIDKRSSGRSYFEAPQDIVINGKTFKMSDLGPEGIGVIVESDRALFPGQRLNAIALEHDGQRRTLKGIVSHITKTGRHIICGIRFEFGSSDDLSFVTAVRKALSGRQEL